MNIKHEKLSFLTYDFKKTKNFSSTRRSLKKVVGCEAF